MLFYVLLVLSILVNLFTSVDFSRENTFAVRELLRLDRGSVVRLAKLAKRDQRYMWIGNVSLILLAAIFGVAPFAASDAWGEHTFVITIGTCLVSLVCFVALFVVVAQAWSLTSVLLRAWGRRVKRYVVKMRDILLILTSMILRCTNTGSATSRSVGTQTLCTDVPTVKHVRVS